MDDVRIGVQCERFNAWGTVPQVRSMQTKLELRLYRDCLRVTKHLAGRGPKADAIMRIIRLEFSRNANVKDKETVSKLKANAVRGLSNYFLQTTGSRDPRLQKKMKDFEERNLPSAP